MRRVERQDRRADIAAHLDVAAWDDNPGARDAAREAGLPVVDINQAVWKTFAALVLAPGVPLTHPEPHWTVERATAFAEADKQIGLDFSRALYAFSELVGPDNVMVQELAVKDSKGHSMVFMAEGAPTDPSTAINALMASVG